MEIELKKRVGGAHLIQFDTGGSGVPSADDKRSPVTRTKEVQVAGTYHPRSDLRPGSDAQCNESFGSNLLF